MKHLFVHEVVLHNVFQKVLKMFNIGDLIYCIIQDDTGYINKCCGMIYDTYLTTDMFCIIANGACYTVDNASITKNINDIDTCHLIYSFHTFDNYTSYEKHSKQMALEMDRDILNTLTLMSENAKYQ